MRYKAKGGSCWVRGIGSEGYKLNQKTKEDRRMGKFQELKVWQRSKDLAVYIYKLTQKGIFSTDFGLRDQIRRAAVSIPSKRRKF